ncbi:hypothetical protein [Streptomyces syringium]|uniref:Immunity protein 49 n=1 Tax=Streptomyces syringium TaxID=76729 RepID=A0ABS4YE15_9ACTN|nr:hypothetical protein [Streptomyces syringium]MBP2407042.1 hypothetical protein [Streptomyces syringium]
MPPSAAPSTEPTADPTADRPALDLLDAYLEARWDGRDLPLPDVMVGDSGDGAGELLHWVIGQFRSIPREPKGAFGRGVGSLLTEFRSRRCPWNAAALRLLGDVYAFAATGPRRQEDWARDALAVLHRSVPDPRGWLRLDCDRNNAARHTVPAYPFDPPAASEFPDRLYPLEREAAVAALAVMTEEWQSEPASVRSRPDRDAVLADARTLLDRYGPTARYWTNATAAASDPSPDFLTAGLQGTRSHGFLTSAYLGGLDLFEDLGLIAVTDDEVGVFWSFGAC